MVTYNPKDWVTLIFNSSTSEDFKRLRGLVIIFGLVTALIVYTEQDILDLPDNHYLTNFSILHSLLGFAISILLVFRTNTAYDRWWEGRKLWGSLVNNSRNLALKINAIYPENQERRTFFVKTIPLYAKVLKVHLQSEKTRLALDKDNHPEVALDYNKHVPNQVAILLNNELQDMLQKKEISGEQLLTLDSEVSAFTDICGACERIKNTPIPYSYSAFLKKFIFYYVITLPIGLSFTLGYFAVPVVSFIFYIMAGLEIVAEEIEDPFGTDENDLPMAKITANIEKNVKEILG